VLKNCSITSDFGCVVPEPDRQSVLAIPDLSKRFVQRSEIFCVTSPSVELVYGVRELHRRVIGDAAQFVLSVTPRLRYEPTTVVAAVIPAVSRATVALDTTLMIATTSATI
jgi:hypothetical protein